MNKDLKEGLSWGGTVVIVALREFRTQAGLHCQSRDYTGGHRHEWAHDRLVWQPVVQDRRPQGPGRPGQTSSRLVHGAERAHLCGTGGIRPDLRPSLASWWVPK